MTNNVGNLRPVGSDTGFVQYDTPEAGIDAMRNDLLAKINGHSNAMKANYGEGYVPTLANVINTYAPPSQNDTANYINNVSKWSGIAPDEVLTPDHIARLQPAMIRMENGQTGVDAYNKYADSGQIMSDVSPDNRPSLDEIFGNKSASEQPDSAKRPSLDEIFGASSPKSDKSATEDSFLGEMAANAKNAVQSGKDLLSGNFDVLHSTLPTPKTDALSEKLFPAGSDGSFLGAMRNLGNTSPSDFSGALLEHFNNTPAGKAVSVIGGLNPLYNAAGTAVNRYVNPAIEKATGISPDSLSLLELAAPTLGLKKAGQINDPVVGAIKKIVASTNKQPAATAADLAASANAAYKLADQNGGVLTPKITDQFLADANGVLPQTAAGKTVFGDSKTATLIDKFNKLKGQPLSLAEAQELDEGLGNAIDSEYQNGRLSKEGKKIQDIQDKLRDNIANASSADVLGGKAGFDALSQARDLWARSRRMSDVERIINRAQGMDQPAKAIQSGFNTLQNNPARMRGFTPAEKAAIQTAAKTGIITDALRVVGSRLTPIAAGAAGYAAGGPLGAFASGAVEYGLSSIARKVAARRQTSRANNVLSTIAQRTPMQPKSALPALAGSAAKQIPNTAADAFLAALAQQNQSHRIGIER